MDFTGQTLDQINIYALENFGEVLESTSKEDAIKQVRSWMKEEMTPAEEIEWRREINVISQHA